LAGDGLYFIGLRGLVEVVNLNALDHQRTLLIRDVQAHLMGDAKAYEK
jgi:hypothetical protein